MPPPLLAEVAEPPLLTGGCDTPSVVVDNIVGPAVVGPAREEDAACAATGVSAELGRLPSTSLSSRTWLLFSTEVCTLAFTALPLGSCHSDEGEGWLGLAGVLDVAAICPAPSFVMASPKRPAGKYQWPVFAFFI